MSLLDGVKETLTNAVLDKAASALGIESTLVKTGMKMFLPAIIGGVINKGGSESGAGALLDLFKKDGYGDNNLGDLVGVFGSPEKTSGLLDQGGNLLSTIFGNKTSGLVDMLVNLTGMKKGIGTTLLKFLAPMVINKLAGHASSNNLDANGLSSYLNGQKSGIMSMVPGLSSFLGGNATKSVGATASRNTTSTHTSNEGGGGGWMKWLLPLLGIAALGYFISQKGCSNTVKEEAKVTTNVVKKTTAPTTTKKVATTNTTTTKAAPATTTTTTTTATTTTYSLNANGDIVSGSGSVLGKKGSYKIDAKGNLVSNDGRILITAANLSGNLLSKIKAALGAAGTGVSQQQMTTMFTNMLVKKAGAKTSYGLSKIEFNKENHKISNFSKAEVMGLAAALKANAKGKIEVRVHTNDGKNAKDNNSLSETRAKVIRDMLVTLGVSKGQISAKGMGNADAGKASAGKVEISIK